MEKTMSKKQMVELLTKYAEGVKALPKELGDRVSYTLKKVTEDSKQVLKADIAEVLDEVNEFVASQMAKKAKVVPMENAKKIAPVENATAEAVEATEEPAEEEKPKKVVKKAKAKEEKEEKPKVVIAKDLVANFPETLETELGNLKLTTDIKTSEDLMKAIEAGRSLVFANFWTKRHLKQFWFSYDPNSVCKAKVKEFPHDLDLAQPIHTTETGFVYALSVYSEVLLVYSPENIEEMDDEGLRYANQVEFCIYEIV